MLKKNLPVTRMRFVSVSISAVLILVSIIAFFAFGGFNTGIDFESGLSQRIQLAPVGMSISYFGDDHAVLSADSGMLTLTLRNDENINLRTFSESEYATVASLADALSSVDGIEVKVLDGSLDSSRLITGYGFPAVLSETPFSLNYGKDGTVTIDQFRASLSGLGNVRIQTVGSIQDQVFQVRLGTHEGDDQVSMERAVDRALASAYGEGQYVVLESSFVGPKFSSTLVSSSLIAIAVALGLILVYIWIRFMFAYAISSIIALFHDVIILLGFIAITGFEVSSTTIAAVLTIIGYSLNATIVIFDRVRENSRLDRDGDLKDIIDLSVTQSLTRTVISSLTTVLAIIPLAIFTSGDIRFFAIELVFGIVIGTYSSNFIAPALLLWISRGKKIEEKKKEEIDRTVEHEF